MRVNVSSLGRRIYASTQEEKDALPKVPRWLEAACTDSGIRIVPHSVIGLTVESRIVEYRISSSKTDTYGEVLSSELLTLHKLLKKRGFGSRTSYFFCSPCIIRVQGWTIAVVDLDYPCGVIRSPVGYVEAKKIGRPKLNKEVAA